jgi:hypothetical protein
MALKFNVIIIKTKVLLPQAYVTLYSILAIMLFFPFGFIVPKTLYYLAFQSFGFQRHLMNVILETHRAH